MQRVSYWLMPAERDREMVSSIIQDLAKRFDAPLFDPHVTLYSGPLQATDAVPRIVREIAALFSPLTLNTTRIGHSDQFTKTLYFEFTTDETLTRLSRTLRERMTVRAVYELHPHLSLIYARLSEEARLQIASKVVWPPSIHFDALRAIRHHGVSTREDVEAWETLAEVPLTEI